MKSEQVIPYTDTCSYLGNTIRGDITAIIWINCILHGERQFAEFGKYHIERIISSFI